VLSTSDSATRGSEDPQHQPNHEHNHPDRPNERNTRDEPNDEKNQTENNHNASNVGAQLRYGELLSAGRYFYDFGLTSERIAISRTFHSF
jgi:hypothetical protein